MRKVYRKATIIQMIALTKAKDKRILELEATSESFGVGSYEVLL